MDVNESTHPERSRLEAWELHMIALITSRIRTSEPDELNAELSRRLLILKREAPPHIRNWKAYVSTALRHRALNWIRDRRLREKRLVGLSERFEDGTDRTFEDTLATNESLGDPAFSGVWRQLGPKLQRFWEILSEENGNQAATARRIGEHRNTVILWVKKIRTVLLREGYVESKAFMRNHSIPGGEKDTTSPPIPVAGFVRLSNHLLDRLLVSHLTGVQLRIILWTIRKTIGWNRRLVRFTWYRVAKELHLDRAGIFRAGRKLVAAKILHVEYDRIGIQPDPTSWQIPAPLRPVKRQPLTGVNGDLAHAKAMTLDNVGVDAGQQRSRRGSTLFRGAKDIHKNTDKDIKKRPSKAPDSLPHPAGAARPIRGKYDDISIE